MRCRGGFAALFLFYSMPGPCSESSAPTPLAPSGSLTAISRRTKELTIGVHAVLRMSALAQLSLIVVT
jgi:hypothetical protein